ncbi:MAG: RraA family protein [Candidatus Tectomicrobia bacterium]|uniref:Putative 4-hydroxy-4-methyl-2-oxoglutarate aldolase n=1 Tax=Tectimicrobiota bacterium TaxID=2528274 RepID=A0A932GMU0_UNCTE|nr:RraA family protein [Candidatus Tectomicrobia bacterium]
MVESKIRRQEFDEQFRPRLEKLATTNLADACDKVGIRGAVIGIRPLFGSPKVIGRALTIKITASGMALASRHLGIDVIALAERGDVVAIDNRGDLYNNCWGEILSYAAREKGVSGVVIDGAARDIDACQEINFPVCARGVVPITARGRIMQESFNTIIRLGDVQVRPGDVIVADVNGVVVIPPERLEEILGAAEEIAAKEAQMVSEILAGGDILEIDKKYSYESMLKKKE